jgi:hypothetical protein
MATVGLAKELVDSPTGNTSVGQGSKTTFQRKFLVETSTVYDGPVVAMYAAGVPADWSYYLFGNEYHLYCRLRSKSAQRKGPNSLFWVVTCNYETEDEEEEEDQDDPTAEKAKLSFDYETTQELVEATFQTSADPVDGVRNSAGELFKQQPTHEVDNIVINITRNENINTDVGTLANTFNNSINSGAWGGFAAHTLRLRMRAERAFREIGESKTQVPYLIVSYSIKHREQTWDLVLLDHGSYYLDASQNKINFKTENGENYLGLLDGSGDQTAVPTFLPAKQIYKETDFSVLTLPTNFLETKANRNVQ